MILRGIITITAVLLIPWLLWGALMLGGWALLLIVPAIFLYWVLTYEFYSKNSDGEIWRFARTKDRFFRSQEKEAAHTEVHDVPSAWHTRAAIPNQTPRIFHGKHKHPVGAGTTFEP